jgi:hypothetical protein
MCSSGLVIRVSFVICHWSGHAGGRTSSWGAWTYVADGYAGRNDVQVLAVCDVWRDRRERATQRVNNHYAEEYGKGTYNAGQAYNDFREVLARPDIDPHREGKLIFSSAYRRHFFQIGNFEI